jgi:hypothetical protein
VIGSKNGYEKEMEYIKSQNQTIDQTNHKGGVSPFQVKGELHPYLSEKVLNFKQQ